MDELVPHGALGVRDVLDGGASREQVTRVVLSEDAVLQIERPIPGDELPAVSVELVEREYGARL